MSDYSDLLTVVGPEAFGPMDPEDLGDFLAQLDPDVLDGPDELTAEDYADFVEQYSPPDPVTPAELLDALDGPDE